MLTHTQEEITAIYDEYVDTVYRVCFTYLKGNRMDIEDAVQSTFIVLMRRGMNFESAAHQKAWLITVSSNLCKNMLKKSSREDVAFETERHGRAEEKDETMEALMEMPGNEALSIYLHYYEGYTAKEIGEMLHKTESTVWGYLYKGRSMLKTMLKEDI